VAKEGVSNEQRVALTPDSVATLIKAGFSAIVESGAGKQADFSDAAYSAVGAVIGTKSEVWNSSIVVKVQPPTLDEADLLKDRCLISLVYPNSNQDIMNRFVANGATVFAMDCIPRLLSRGQAYDVLSSQANVAGYRAVIESANEFGRQFTGQMTAAGKIPPAKVLVLGAGVAGLAAIGTAKSMGGVVTAYDVRPAAAEQVYFSKNS
jgi:NAD(P) transhydrogenase